MIENIVCNYMYLSVPATHSNSLPRDIDYFYVFYIDNKVINCERIEITGYNFLKIFK